MNMSRGYSICEPHPTVPSRGRSAYIQAGRGGAGNIKRYNSSELTHGPAAAGPASRTALSPAPPSTKFTAGRGGAGNTFTSTPSQRAMFSFDEELRRDEMIRANMSKAPIYHVGRGGAGNTINEMQPRGGMNGSTGASISSSGSTASSVSNGVRGMFRSLSRTISRDSRH